MRYISTRDESEDPVKFSFLDAVLMGMAPDGGLLVPEFIPVVTASEWNTWRLQDYQMLCQSVLRKFICESEIGDLDLQRMIAAAYSKTFSGATVAPLTRVGNVWVLELFHGPTFAFKDVALQLLGQLFDFALAARKTRMTILGATSGDTGSAAIAGVKGRPNIDCVILFPLGKTSKIQELQMTANLDANIHCLGVKDSVFDDCQSIVKACFADKQFSAEMNLGAVNSINWARILAQIVYYVAAAAAIEAPAFVVPTGNFGNVLAGYYAHRMQIPIGRLVIASNQNDILPRFFQTGEYRLSAKVTPTMSPSMDIAVSSNFERFLFDLVSRSGAQVASKFQALKTEGAFAVTPSQLETAREIFAAFAVSEPDCLDTIKSVFRSHNYLLCPHSAVGYAAAQKWIGSSTYQGEPVVTLATAHIGKFTEQIFHSLGPADRAFKAAVEESVPAALSRLESAATRRSDVANTVDSVKQYLRSHVRRQV